MVMAELPKKLSRRIWSIYVVVTLFGGIILFLFVVLLGLTYWMSARAPMPDPNLLIHPKATAWLVIHANSLRDLPQDALRFLTDGAPPQIKNLVALANDQRPCRIQIVLSAYPGEHGREESLAISLGRFPGRFWLVRRDLERGVEKQKLPMSLRYRQGKAIFTADEPANPLNTLSLAECTVLRCANSVAAETLVDRLEKKADLAGDRWPRALVALPLAGFQGWAASWKEIPIATFFPADSGSFRNWQSLTESLAAQFPVLALSRDVRIDGTFHDQRHAETQMTLQTDTLTAVSLAAKVGEWMTAKKITGFARAGASGDSIELMKVEVHFVEE